MATEYTWSFSNFETDSDNKVKTIHWRLTAVDGDYSTDKYGSCAGSDGMDFNSMTKDDCIACVIDSEDKTEAQIKLGLDGNLTAIKTPVLSSKTKSW